VLPSAILQKLWGGNIISGSIFWEVTIWERLCLLQKQPDSLF